MWVGVYIAASTYAYQLKSRLCSFFCVSNPTQIPHTPYPPSPPTWALQKKIYKRGEGNTMQPLDDVPPSPSLLTSAVASSSNQQCASENHQQAPSGDGGGALEVAVVSVPRTQRRTSSDTAAVEDRPPEPPPPPPLLLQGAPTMPRRPTTAPTPGHQRPTSSSSARQVHLSDERGRGGPCCAVAGTYAPLVGGLRYSPRRGIVPASAALRERGGAPLAASLEVVQTWFAGAHPSEIGHNRRVLDSYPTVLSGCAPQLDIPREEAGVDAQHVVSSRVQCPEHKNGFPLPHRVLHAHRDGQRHQDNMHRRGAPRREERGAEDDSIVVGGSLLPQTSVVRGGASTEQQNAPTCHPASSGEPPQAIFPGRRRRPKPPHMASCKPPLMKSEVVRTFRAHQRLVSSSCVVEAASLVPEVDGEASSSSHRLGNGRASSVAKNGTMMSDDMPPAHTQKLLKAMYAQFQASLRQERLANQRALFDLREEVRLQQRQQSARRVDLLP